MHDHTPSAAALHDGMRIVSRAFDSWNVEFRIGLDELLDSKSLVHHLRRVKAEVAAQHSIPDSCLEFDGIIQKARHNDFVKVRVRVKKKPIAKGNPKITFADAIDAGHDTYSHLAANLDIFYLDEFERLITHDRIMQSLREARVKTELIDMELLNRRLEDVLSTQIPSMNIPIAAGTLPEAGRDAEVEFFFQAVAEANGGGCLFSSRRVNCGDLLCRKIPAAAGLRAGINVHGERLPPRVGLDIEIAAGKNAVLSLDECEIVAETDGVAVIQREIRRLKTLSGSKEIPARVTVKVNPVLRLDGSEVIDIATSQSVEVSGNLRMGSRILTDCEIFVSGDVEEGSLVEAADCITVEGKVTGATLSSNGRVTTGGDVSASHVSAVSDVAIRGIVSGSTVSGDSIRAESASGSTLLARTNITLERIDADENNIVSTICVGMQDFLLSRLSENQEFIETARANLERIELVVGRDIMEQVTASNAQTMLMRLLSRLHIEPGTKLRTQVKALRSLLDVVPPTKALMMQKVTENMELVRKLAERSAAESSTVIVRERVAAKSFVSIEGVQGVMEPTTSGIMASVVRNRLAFARDLAAPGYNAEPR